MVESPGQQTLGDLLARGRSALSRATFEPSRREAALILAHLLGCSEASIRARTEQPVAPEVVKRFEGLLERRLEGEPIAYLFGEREFFGRPFRVDRRVLIPRPETEHLVETATKLALPEPSKILDIGAGSGCLAVTLALEIPEARVVATDLSLEALQVARDNGHRLGAGASIRWLRADLAHGLDLGRFDLVVSNPPYVAPEAAATLSPEVHDFEPHLALYAADRGRAAISGLLDQMHDAKPGAYLLLEIGFDQSEWLRERAERARHLELIEIIPDYGGIPRVGVLRRRDPQEIR